MDKTSGGEGREKLEDIARDTVEPGEALTTNQGLKIADDQNSLKAGPRGPSLLEDFYLREKITHFDHERIPERVVHARGAAAHGYFESYGDFGDLTMAKFLGEKGKQTPVFLRFSTVAGSRGSADTPRDVRGFAVKFYTEEGIWDLVGNDMPVFFIQDAIKFPDLIHAVKPEPHNEIPQAQSAHDTFWDFASLTPEITHMLLWVMSDRGIPRSFAMVEGFGVHTFRLVNAQGVGRFVKFHFKPVKGIHSLVWDEAQKIAGKDPDFNRRDLFEAIERGDFPTWEFGVQIVEEADEHKFDFDLLDATKLIPEELVPIKPLGKLVLNRNPDNYFSETEQVAFHLGHVVPGIDFTNDPLLQGRLFSYLDTQLLRVGPNFAQLPINRPINPVHNNQRDGIGRQTVNKGRVAYFPNSLGGGCPMHNPEAADAFRSYQEKVDGQKVRVRSESFSDHFSQATLFWNSMSDWEKQHIVEAFAFELNMVDSDEVRSRVVNELLVKVDGDFVARISDLTGIPVTGKPVQNHGKSSPALSMDKPAKGIKGRKIAVLAGDGVDAAPVLALRKALTGEGAVVEIIGPKAGSLKTKDGKELKVDRAAPNAPSVIYDAAVVAGGDPAALKASGKTGLTLHFIAEAFTHAKPIAILPQGAALYAQTGLPDDAPGIVTDPRALIPAIEKHRHFDRAIADVPA